MSDLPNEDREKRHVATGPNVGLSIRGLTGFFTNAASLDFGVNVQGIHCGVYEESGIQDSPRRGQPGSVSMWAGFR